MFEMLRNPITEIIFQCGAGAEQEYSIIKIIFSMTHSREKSYMGTEVPHCLSNCTEI